MLLRESNPVIMASLVRRRMSCNFVRRDEEETEDVISYGDDGDGTRRRRRMRRMRV